MSKTEKRVRLWLIMTIAAPVSAVISVALILWFGLSGWYVPTVIAAVFALHGFYGIPFYTRALVIARREASCLSLYDSGTVDLLEIAEVTGLTVGETRRRLERALLREGREPPAITEGCESTPDGDEK